MSGVEPIVDSRRSPMLAQGLLLAAFVVVLAISVFTVLIPELADDGPEEPQGAETEDAAEEAAAD